MRIDAEFPETRAACTRIAELVCQAGGWLHPGLVVHQRGDNLWASFEGAAEDDEPLLHLPITALVPITGLIWDDRADFALGSERTPLSPLRREMLAALLRLYRSTGKQAWARRHLPGLALATDDPLRPLLAAWGHGPDPSAPFTEMFLQSRCIGMPEGEGRVPALFPLGELLNHHPAGAPLLVTADTGITVRRAQPAPDAQCYANYGIKDALELLLVYGYVDDHARHVKSLPLEIELPGLGRLQIRGRGHRPGHDLPKVERQEGRLSLSHLNFRCTRPGHSQSLLRLIVGNQPLPLSRSGREALALQAHEALVAANLDAWARLLRLATQDAAADRGGPIHRMFAEVALRQQQRIRNAVNPVPHS